jgi:hypothetical protein
MSKKPPIIGKIISTRIIEVDQSLVTNTDNMSMEEKIEHIKTLFEFEDDKTIMDKMIEELKNQPNYICECEIGKAVSHHPNCPYMNELFGDN